MTENVVYWAVRTDSEPLKGSLDENHRGLLYNIRGIECPFRGGKRTGPEYGNIADLDADWFVGYSYFHQFASLAALSCKYGDKLLFFGCTLADCDNDSLEELLKDVVESEEEIHRVFKGR